MPDPIKVRVGREPRIRQGDIFRDVEFVESVIEEEGIVRVARIIFPFVVVLTQDCDLAQDFKARYGRKTKPSNQDKFLISVLVAPLYNVDHVCQGEHLSELDIQMATVPRTGGLGSSLLQNKRPRYHYLEFSHEVPLPNSIVDFKHHFSVTVEYLKRVKQDDFVCNIAPVYREDLGQRFSSFLSRIGLPEKKSGDS
jgi:hypothetical protein